MKNEKNVKNVCKQYNSLTGKFKTPLRVISNKQTKNDKR